MTDTSRTRRQLSTGRQRKTGIQIIGHHQPEVNEGRELKVGRQVKTDIQRAGHLLIKRDFTTPTANCLMNQNDSSKTFPIFGLWKGGSQTQRKQANKTREANGATSQTTT